MTFCFQITRKKKATKEERVLQFLDLLVKNTNYLKLLIDFIRLRFTWTAKKENQLNKVNRLLHRSKLKIKKMNWLFNNSKTRSSILIISFNQRDNTSVEVKADLTLKKVIHLLSYWILIIIKILTILNKSLCLKIMRKILIIKIFKNINLSLNLICNLIKLKEHIITKINWKRSQIVIKISRNNYSLYK